MTWSRSQYEDRIRDRLGDLGLLQHIEEPRIPLALERALATFTKDHPRQTTQTFSGNDTIRTFDLTADLTGGWEAGWSRVLAVEHPTGDIPKTLIDSHGWTEEDGILAIHTAPSAGVDNIAVRHTAAWSFPDDDPSDDPAPIPELYAQAVADLAASVVIRGVAVEYARQQSQSVAGQLFQRDPSHLFAAAADLKKAYEETVLGRAAGEGAATQVALTTADVDVFPATLFHRRSQILGDEQLGD